MKNLYCFRLNEDLSLTRFEITEYDTNENFYTKKKTYSFSEPKVNKSDKHYTVPEAKLDRFLNNKVYTFIDDENYAWEIIKETLFDKIYVMQKELGALCEKVLKLGFDRQFSDYAYAKEREKESSNDTDGHNE